jgi:hypothetical protein
MSFFPLLTGFLSFFLSFSFRSPQFFISIPGLYKIRTELLPKTKHKHAKHTYEREHATRTTISSYRLLKTAITFTFALFCWIPYLNYLTPQAKKRYRRENRKHSTARERERERERERRGEESTALGGGEAAATAAPNPDHTAKSVYLENKKYRFFGRSPLPMKGRERSSLRFANRVQQKCIYKDQGYMRGLTDL